MIDLIPKAIARELAKLVRSRDTWKRRALDRAADRSPERRREIENRDKAVERLLFLISVEGVGNLARGGWGCLYEALEALRPDVAKVYSDEGGGREGARAARLRFFPSEDDLADEARAGDDE